MYSTCGSGESSGYCDLSRLTGRTWSRPDPLWTDPWDPRGECGCSELWEETLWWDGCEKVDDFDPAFDPSDKGLSGKAAVAVGRYGMVSVMLTAEERRELCYRSLAIVARVARKAAGSGQVQIGDADPDQ